MLETTAHENNNILLQREVAPRQPKPATFRLNWTVSPVPVLLFPAAMHPLPAEVASLRTRRIVSVY